MSPCELLSSSCGSGGGDCDRRRERGVHSSLSAASNVLEGVRPPIELLAGLHARDGSRHPRHEKRHLRPDDKAGPGLAAQRARHARATCSACMRHDRGSRGVEGGSRTHRWPIGPHKIVAGAEAAYSKVVLVLGMSSIDLLNHASSEHVVEGATEETWAGDQGRSCRVCQGGVARAQGCLAREARTSRPPPPPPPLHSLASPRAVRRPCSAGSWSAVTVLAARGRATPRVSHLKGRRGAREAAAGVCP